jgi:hypothetical protein
MNYKILNNNQLIIDIVLHGKEMKVTLDYNAIANAVRREDKFRRKASDPSQERFAYSNLNDYLNDFQRAIDYLKNVPLIDEKHIGYALQSLCFNHVLKFGRLIDNDLCGYADLVLTIFESWIGSPIIYQRGFEIRSQIIKMILQNFGDSIFISYLESPTSQFSLIKYDKAKNNVGFMLRL